MHPDWPMTHLAKLVDIRHGFAFSGAYIHDIPVGDILLTPRNFEVGGGFKGNTFKYYDGPVPDDFVLSEGDLLVTMTDLSKTSDTLGYPALVPAATSGHRYLHNQRLGRVVIKSGAPLDKRFLYYVLCSRSYRNEILASATGTTVKHTSPTRIGQYKFPLPPISTQRAITHVLGALDDKIELNRRMSETLEQIARTQFRDWFADKLGKVQAGECPSWKVKPLDEIADFLNGAACQRFPPIEGEPWLPVIKIRELNQGITEQSDRVAANIPEKWHIKDGDVLFSWSGTLLAKKWTGGNAALNQHLFKVTSAKYPKWFYFQWVLHHLEAFRSIAADKATTMGHIRRHHLTEALCVVPDSDSLSEMGAIMEPIHRRWLMCELESRTLAELRDTLLPKLISGELRVPEAEQLVSEVA